MKANTFISACNLFSFAFVLDLNPVSPNTGFKRCLSSLPCKRFYLLESHSVCLFVFNSVLRKPSTFCLFVFNLDLRQIVSFEWDIKSRTNEIARFGETSLYLDPACCKVTRHPRDVAATCRLEVREKRGEVRGETVLAVTGWELATGQNMATYARHCLYLAFKLFIDPMTFFFKAWHYFFYSLYFL